LALQLPPLLTKSLEAVNGFDVAAFEQVHQSGEQIVSIRANPAKFADTATLLRHFNELINAAHATEITPVPWSSHGYYLPHRPFFTFDPLLHAGAYYVQEASSMFLEQALRQTTHLNQPLKVLDLCAAPGGKSTLLQSMLSAESILVSNEVIKQRAAILEENISKWGAANMVVTNNDPAHFARLENYFDVLVVDAPCSGSGLFRKDPAAIEEWSENNVALCSQRQQRILMDAWPALKEGGLLIYSTCSYSAEEDEKIADWLMQQLQVNTCRLQVQPAWGIEEVQSATGAYGYRFWPYKVKGEGFFLAAFRKQSGGDSTATVNGNKAERLTKAQEQIVASWLRPVTNFQWLKQKEEVLLLPDNLATALPTLQQALYIKKAGITIGKLVHNELVPHHDFAMSNYVSDAIVRVALNKEEALQYLRRNNVVSTNNYKGWALVQYAQQSLGWVKLLQNRVNNYYPKEWRILKQ
jgi:16S rRNA C967 or C1407 C5-methylase (RsmB/RsmF family)/NOL1/NOP2/fmu family ribosome biogenesis protein